MQSGIEIITLLAAFAFIIWFTLILPARMAIARGRSPGLWVLASIFISPVLAVLILLLIGKA